MLAKDICATNIIWTAKMFTKAAAMSSAKKDSFDKGPAAPRAPGDGGVYTREARATRTPAQGHGRQVGAWQAGEGSRWDHG